MPEATASYLLALKAAYRRLRCAHGRTDGGGCPECGGRVRVEGGCPVCLDCGASKCGGGR